LEIAASLDDALAAARPAATGGATQALARLREEVAFARRALPEVDAVRREGTTAGEAEPAAPGPRGRVAG
jgi:hypothetical protein